MSNLVKFITHNIGRVFVCPDVHGMYDDFLAELKRVDFNYDEDLIISLGDLVDRGNNSLDSFNICYLSYVETVRGNHEEFCYVGADHARFEHHISHGGEWFYNLPQDVKTSIKHKIDSLPILITLERHGKRYGFVHANIPVYIDDWDILVARVESGDQQVIADCLWLRDRIKNKHMYTNIITGVDEVFIGHTIVKDKVKFGNINYIDQGCFLKEYKINGKLELVEI